MENEENTVDFQDETQEEDTFEVDESESSDESTDNDENSTQYQEELKKKDAEIAKLNRLLKKTSKDEKPLEKPSDDSNVVTKADLERIRLEAKGFDDDQIEFLMKFGGTQALKDDAIKTVVDTMAEKKKQLNAQATSKTQGTSSRRYSQEDLRAMPLEKLEKLIKEGKIK
jgi:hypothetical protein